MRPLAPQLEERKALQRYRQRHLISSRSGVMVTCEGHQLLDFSSNDYLGLAQHPLVIEAFQRGAGRYGVGSGAAHLITGHLAPHHQLEEELAEFVGRPRALLFSTGYMANLGVMSALMRRGDQVLEDRLNHASLLDGALLSGARLQRYPHGDMAQLAKKLTLAAPREQLIATDGVFSMDGDIAPLAEMAPLAARHNAWLMVDDAHGFGVLGPHGAGTLEQLGLSPQQVPILMATLGKAVGTFGAFVAGSETLIETLIQQARSYIYTTALPPAVAEATRAALRLIQGEPERRHHLQQLIQRFRQGAAALGLPIMASPTAIQPLLVGDEVAAMALSEQLRQAGLWVSPIRPPTVPVGSARLRITLSANHQQGDIDRLLEALATLTPQSAGVPNV